MSQRQNFVTVIFWSEFCINTYFIDSWNPIITKTAQGDMVIYDIKYNILQKKFLKISISSNISTPKKPPGKTSWQILCFN